jgi:protein ImuB
LYACLYQPPRPAACPEPVEGPAGGGSTLVSVAQTFSPRYERHRDDLVSIDISGLDRLFGDARAIGTAIGREAAARGLRAHVAVASTRTAAMVLVMARPGLSVIPRGAEAAALAPLALGILEQCDIARFTDAPRQTADFKRATFKRWGLRTLGELAALPASELTARFGRQATLWQAIARGEDVRPLVPTLEEERFELSLDLEWPIEGMEPLSFALTRLLEPLSTRLERRDRGAAVLHVLLDLVTKERCTRRLQLPTPMRDVRALRTLALLDLEAHPPVAAIDRVTIVIDPTPGRVLQHTLFTRPYPTPEQLSTLVARLGALMGQDRFGTPAIVDAYRPGAFGMAPFRLEPPPSQAAPASAGQAQPPAFAGSARFGEASPVTSHQRLASALRRCRQPVPARVAANQGRPMRVTTDRRGFSGGSVVSCAGPWRTSGEWWAGGSWDRDEWDVSLSDGGVYRVFRERETDRWFIDAIVD